MSQTPLTDALWKLYEREYEPTLEQRAQAFAVWSHAMKEYEERQLFWMDPRTKDRSGRLYASDPYFCPRKLALLLRGEKGDPVKGRGCFSMPVGNLMEAKIVCDLILAGVPVISPNPEQRRHTMHVAGLEWSGYSDVIVDGVVYGPQYAGQEIPIDVKSTDPYTFKSWVKSGPKNDWSYVDQLAGGYAKNLSAPFGVFLLLDRGIGKFHEFRVGDVDEAHKRITKAAGVAQEKIEKGSLPGMPSWATVKDMPRAKCQEIENKRCSYCPFKEHCFEGFEATTVSGQIKWRKPLEEGD